MMLRDFDLCSLKGVRTSSFYSEVHGKCPTFDTSYLIFRLWASERDYLLEWLHDPDWECSDPDNLSLPREFL
jgi:hypothetical protein